MREEVRGDTTGLGATGVSSIDGGIRESLSLSNPLSIVRPGQVGSGVVDTVCAVWRPAEEGRGRDRSRSDGGDGGDGWRLLASSLWSTSSGSESVSRSWSSSSSPEDLMGYSS